MIKDRISRLRSLMKEHKLDAYIVFSDDFHGSEYVGEFFRCRQFITGFTGSAGTAVITEQEAGLWTDGRYFIQAAAQLSGSGVTLFRSGEEGVPTIEEYLEQTLKKGDTVGFDGRTISISKAEELQKHLAKKEIVLSGSQDLIGEIWTDRPALSCAPAWELAETYTGKSRSKKLVEIRRTLEEKNADYFLLTSLEDIAWLLNIRGNDISCVPVVLAYLLMTPEETLLFAQEQAFAPELIRELQNNGVFLRPYEQIYDYIGTLPENKKMLLDPAHVNSTLGDSVSRHITQIRCENPTLLPKACKNSTEQENIRQAHIRDGVAVTRFMHWVKEQVGKENITELSAAEKLEEFRSQQENYLGPSFNPIIAYAEHAAICHYSATLESDIALMPKGLLLADTGGHYLEGSTDITRTIALGETTRKEKEYFTRVLRGNLELAAAKFLAGSSGVTLDYLARKPLWEIGEDYKHGTGHGVGYLLSVHEGPNTINYRPRSASAVTPFEEGMLTSDEPGYYAEGEFGIRHENLMLCKKAEKTAAGQFMEFETVTLVPFDLDAILPEEMSARERTLLNQYHKKVFDTLSPYLEENEKEWLKTATREI